MTIYLADVTIHIGGFLVDGDTPEEAISAIQEAIEGFGFNSLDSDTVETEVTRLNEYRDELDGSEYILEGTE